MSLLINTRTKNVKLGLTFDQIEADEIIDSATRTSDTSKVYAGVIRRLKEFLKVPPDLVNILALLLTDRNLALFSLEYGKTVNELSQIFV